MTGRSKEVKDINGKMSKKFERRLLLKFWKVQLVDLFRSRRVEAVQNVVNHQKVSFEGLRMLFQLRSQTFQPGRV